MYSDLNILLTRSVIIIGSFMIWIVHRFTYWRRHGVPGPNHIDIFSFFTIHHDFTLEQVKRYGRIFGSYDFVRKSIIIVEPDLIRDIMVKDFHIFPDHKLMHTGSTLIGLSLFFMPGNEDWKRVRSILTPAFTSGKLKAMMSHISDISDKLVNHLDAFVKNGEILDARRYVGAFAMDVISACAYGIDLDSINNPDHPLVVNARKLLNLDGTISLYLSVLAPKLARYFKLEMLNVEPINYFAELTNKIVDERRKSRKETEAQFKRKTDFIQLMLDSVKNDNELQYELNTDVEMEAINEHKVHKIAGTLSRDELTAQGILFFIAGYDTTSAAISHAIYYLSQNKDCQQRLYEELRAISDFSYENLNQLKYLNAVINESLRLAPSLTRIQRECLKDYKLGNTGITIPAGSSVEILPYALHRLPEHFPEPDCFKPERFLDPQHHPYAFVTFGGGPRLCLGQRFALNEMRMCLSKLFNKFEFDLIPGFQIEYFKGNVMMSPKDVLVNIKLRN